MTGSSGPGVLVKVIDREANGQSHKYVALQGIETDSCSNLRLELQQIQPSINQDAACPSIKHDSELLDPFQKRRDLWRYQATIPLVHRFRADSAPTIKLSISFRFGLPDPVSLHYGSDRIMQSSDSPSNIQFVRYRLARIFLSTIIESPPCRPETYVQPLDHISQRSFISFILIYTFTDPPFVTRR